MMTVAQLIALLKTMPKNALVTGYNGQEETDFVTPKGVRYSPVNQHKYNGLRGPDGAPYHGPVVDIMGF